MAFVGIWLRALVVGIPLIFAAFFLRPYYEVARIVGRPADYMALGGFALLLGLSGVATLLKALGRSIKLSRELQGSIKPTGVDTGGEFDADAVFARAMARRAMEGSGEGAPDMMPNPQPASSTMGATRGFGRKVS